jgi:competence protein ComEC
MQLLKFVPIKLTLFLILGIIIGWYTNINFTILFSLVIGLLIVAGFLFKSQKRTNTYLFGFNSMLLTFCIGLLAISINKPKNNFDHYSKHTNSNPQELHLKISEVLKSNAFSERYIGKVSQVKNNHTTGEILITISKDSLKRKLHIDNELIVYEKTSPIKKPLNPYEFDYNEYLEKIGVYDQLYLKSSNYIPIKNYKTSLYGTAAKLRIKIIKNLREEQFGNDELGIIQALLLGERNDISKETFDNYKNAGAIHILAVSGLHIGILLLILQFLLQPIENLLYGKKIKLILIVILLWAFAFLAGLSASIVRAVTMFSFLAYAEYLNRPANKFNILALSMFFTLLIKPTYLFNVGFQMSYAAVFAILWVYPILQGFWFPKNIILNKGWQLMSVSIAAQLGVIPISLFYFHQFPGLFFISNLIIIPCLGFILSGGILVILLSLLNILPNYIVVIYNALIQFMNTIVGWIAQQESFIFKNISFDTFQLLLAYVAITSLVLCCTKATFKRVVIFLISILLFQSYLLFSEFKTQQNKELIVLHQSKNSALVYKKGNTAIVLSNQPNRLKNILNNYRTGEKIKTLQNDSLNNSYNIQEKRIYVIDSNAVLDSTLIKVDYLMLTQSPKINLERCLSIIQPKMIIADGSNYTSIVNKWKETCVKKKLPFHYTGEKGTYYFNLKKN